jgi:hypothetical protein
MSNAQKTPLLKPTKSTEFSPDHWTSFHLSDTIPVPAPSQPSARLYYGVRFLPPVTGDDVESQFYFKVVQVIHERELITRTFDEGSVKAIRYRAPAPPHGEPTAPGWTLKTIQQLAKELEKQRALLLKEAEREAKAVAIAGEKPVKVTHETLLFEHAVLFVPAVAPVLLRRDHGLTAAEADHILSYPGPCC